MSDLLRLVALAQTAASAKTMLRAAGWLLAAIVLWRLWVAESSGARVLAFIGADAALSFGIWNYLRAPLEWSKYLFVKTIFLVLGMSRIVCKFILICVAAILSTIYFISPIDIIPDILIGLGWVDDALVAFGLFSYAANSNYTLPVPNVSAEDAAEQPAWKIGMVVSVATLITWTVRVATM